MFGRALQIARLFRQLALQKPSHRDKYTAYADRIGGLAVQLVRTAEELGWEDEKLGKVLEADEIIHGGIKINSFDTQHKEFLATPAMQHYLDMRFKK